MALGANLEGAAKAAIKEQGALLVAQTHAFIIERASQRLHTRRGMYVEALSHFQDGEGNFIISLNKKAVFIEDGMPAHSLLDDLLKSKKAKRAKDGSVYVVVPFELKKGPTQLTPAQISLSETLKSTMKKLKIPYGSLEKDANGTPKQGLLHRFDINDGPPKTQGPWGGSSQGHGPLGAVQQGNTGIPFLQGVNVYQRETENPDGSKSVKKSIVTFRVASSKMKGSGKWDHPGLEPCGFFEEAVEWGQHQWDTEIVPAIIDQISASL